LLENDTIRMGLRYVKGLGAREEEALKWAPPPYHSLEDFVARTRMNRNAYAKLAESGALDSLVQGQAGRRDALWEVRELHTRLQDSLTMPASPEEPVRFAALSNGEEILWDYRRTHHSTRGHPIENIRKELSARGMPTARELNARPHGTHARYVGMTICRQRPGTATGVTFYTLEDETGFVNLVVWRQVFDRHTVLARTALLLGVTGRLQVESNVVHLIADELWDPEFSVAGDGTTTRNFH
jgi:error-prone DNA polymerase